MRKAKTHVCSCQKDVKCQRCVEKAKAFEDRIQNFKRRFCMDKLYPQCIQIFSKFIPTLPLIIPIKVYQHLVGSTNSFKMLAGMEKEVLKKIPNLIGEVIQPALSGSTEHLPN